MMLKNRDERTGLLYDIKNDWLAVLLIIASIISGFTVYPYLPEMVPSHWNIQGQVDGY